MYPEFFQIGPFPIRAYGVMLALAFFAGVMYIRQMSIRDNKPFEPLLAVAYITIFAGILGGRLSYVLFHLEDFYGNWGATFNPFHSGSFGIAGLNLYGGVVLAIISVFIFCRIKRMPFLDIFDYFAPTVGSGLALGRIGCYLNGCCFGTPCDLPWAHSWPIGSIPYYVFGDLALHPAQLYSAIYGLGLFIGLHFVLKNRKFVGQPTAIFLMIESAFRIAIEYVRYYENAMYFSIGETDITYNLAIGVALFALGLGIYLSVRKADQSGAILLNS